MDLVDYSEERFDEIVRDLSELGSRLGVHDARMIPISALKGDNVVDRTDAMPWYEGPTLLEHLETIELAADANLSDRRLPVQWVIRPMAEEHHDYRGYAGQVAGGTWREGDEVVVLPSGLRSRVARVDGADGEAIPGQSVTILLADDVDVSRGDMLADPASPPVVARELTARVCWLSERPVEDRARLLVKHTTRSVTARLEEIVSVVDIATLEDRPAPGRMELNDLGLVRFRLAERLAVDPYARNRATGAFVLIDEATNETVGAGMVVDAS
jgi:sulfate adenylyltransferase subunit 1 (EFTu-like GTPase family)